MSANHPAIRYAELLNAARDRLRASARLTTILGGATRAYLDRDHDGKPEGPETTHWARVMVKSTANLWGEVHIPHAPRSLGILFRVEANDYRESGFDVAVQLEAAQSEIYDQIDQWLPALNAFTNVKVVFPCYLWQPAEPEPRFEEADGVFYSSSVYRTLVSFVGA